MLELPKDEPPNEELPVDKVAPVPPVPTLVSRGKTGADMVELSPNELPELPAPFGDIDIPPRFPAAPGEVVVWALIAARRGPTESFCGTLTRRLKGRGMHWDAENAQSMMALASLYYSDLWTDYWAKQRAA